MMNTQPTRITCLVWMGTLLVCLAARAELPMESYVRFQAAAPEALYVEMETVMLTKVRVGEDTQMEVKAIARICNIERTSSSLRRGQRITILYRHTERAIPMPGPSETPLVAPGKRYPAYVKWDAKVRAFAPAAGGYTFERALGNLDRDPIK